jgi:LysR family transcriptional activator of nhaA
MNTKWLNYHHLYYFWLLSKEGSFTKVAEKLAIAQSAVSGQINQLEESLGMSLIDRSNKRRPIFTEEGKKVLDYADNIFETGEELLQWARTGSTQKELIIKIGALSGLSRNFQYEFIKPTLNIPNLKVELITGDQSKLTKMLSEHNLDLFLSSHNVVSDGRTTFFSHVLYTSSLVFVISKKGLKGKPNLLEQLTKKRLYLPGKSFEARPELDAYLVGEFEPVEKSSGKVIAIIHRTNDDDDKLIVSKDGNEYSDDAIRALTEFQEKYFESVIIR